MAFLLHPLPPIEVFVKAEYLYNHRRGHGQVIPGLWISVKSIPGKAFYFETLLTGSGALYDKLPISAFQSRETVDKNEQLPLDALQIWDALSYDITVLRKPLLSFGSVYGKDRRIHKGEYLFTIDNCHAQNSELDLTFSERDSEHKSYNVLRLQNGQFCAQPNNRILWHDQSLIPAKTTPVDFEICTQDYKVESGNSKWNVGDTSAWAYRDASESAF